MENDISLNRFISASGLCSRREADEMIEQGRVYINGRRAEKGNRVKAGDKVTVDGEVLQNQSKDVVIGFYKPKGISTTTDTNDKANIISFIDHPEHIFPIGKLDKDASGLILLTNRSDLANKMKKMEGEYKKEFIVQLNKPVNKEMLKSISKGVKLKKGKSKPCNTYSAAKHAFGIIVSESQSRLIRTIVAMFGYRILALHCDRIMHIKLGKMKPGRWRNLNSQEMHLLEERFGL